MFYDEMMMTLNIYKAIKYHAVAIKNSNKKKLAELLLRYHFVIMNKLVEKAISNQKQQREREREGERERERERET